MTRPQSLSDLGIKRECSAVAAAIKFNNLHLFSAPFQCIDSNSEHVLFHAIGGRCFENEGWPEALRREVMEELEEEITFLPVLRTRLYSSDGYCDSLDICDSPRPCSIINKTASNDRNFYHSDVNCLVAYQAQLASESIYPKQEVALLVLVTDDMLIRCLRGEVTYQDIALSIDGSHIIVREEACLNYEKLALPAGLAFILAQELQCPSIEN